MGSLRTQSTVLAADSVAHDELVGTVEKSTKFGTTLFQERAVFGERKMDPAKRAQTQNAGEVSSLQWFFSQSVELMTD